MLRALSLALGRGVAHRGGRAVVRALSFALAFVVAWLGGTGDARAEKRMYLLSIGNNAPPAYSTASDARLPPLRFADDDAAALFALLAPTAHDAELLAVLDSPSQARFPGLATRARPPTLAELRRLVARWKVRFEADQSAGHEPVFILFFSGHGTRGAEDPPSLVLADGPLTQAFLYDEILAQLPARYAHLLVDACYAESIVRPRDGQASAVDLSQRDLQSFAARTTLARFPHVGAIIAASTTARTFEWDALERGVFTHALLSGLRGAADVNGDGRIEYSEIDAFLSAAHRGVTDPRARLSVLTHPPPIDRRVPIVDRITSSKSATLVGAPPSRRFHLEDAAGNRVLDANLEPGFGARLVVPSGRLYLRADELEAALDLHEGDRVDLASLRWSKPTGRARGAVEGALERGLFATPYGPRYYRAFVDGRGEPHAVPIAEPERDAWAPAAAGPAASASSRRVLGWGMLAGAGALAVATGISGAYAVDAKADYEGTTLEREASDARDRFTTFRSATIVGVVATAAVTGLGAWLLLRGPSSRSPRATSGLRVSPGGGLAW